MNKPEILYQDNSIIVCRKPAGVPTQSARSSMPDMVSLLKNELYKHSTVKKEPYLALIHRLDQPVGGILVFALTREAAACLSSQLQSAAFTKDYLAILKGSFETSHGTWTDYLLKDGRTNTSRIVPKGTPNAKKAVLSYEIVSEAEQISRLEASTGTSFCLNRIPKGYSLACIHLETGRHHQIRVQSAGAGHPILGDRKYSQQNGADKAPAYPALSAFHLAFVHPKTKKLMEFYSKPEWL